MIVDIFFPAYSEGTLNVIKRRLHDISVVRVTESVVDCGVWSMYSFEVRAFVIADVWVEGYSINDEDVEIAKNLCLVKYGGGP